MEPTNKITNEKKGLCTGFTEVLNNFGRHDDMV